MFATCQSCIGVCLTISKNFPYEAGLGSASSNVASVIKILENLELIKKKNIFDYVDLGSDIPIFLNQKDALVRGRGDLIANVHFPKYYFLLIRPSFKCSTKKMYDSGSDKILDNLKIETLIDKLVDSDKKYPVVCNETGELLGEIDRSIVMRSMTSKSQ